VAVDTVDEDVMKALEGKATTQEALITAVKARMQKVFQKVREVGLALHRFQCWNLKEVRH